MTLGSNFELDGNPTVFRLRFAGLFRSSVGSVVVFYCSVSFHLACHSFGTFSLAVSALGKA